jgi:vancomycin resistance protein YoaR
MLLVLAVLLTSVAIRGVHTGKVLPGVRVAGVSLGGLDEDAAQRRLRPALRTGKPVTLVAAGRTLPIDPQKAGYFADVDATVARAMDSGRGGPLGGLWSTFSGIFSARDVSPTVTVDQRLLRRTVADAARRIESRTFAGALVIQPESLVVSTTPPRAGREVDRAQLQQRLAQQLRHRTGGRVEVPLRATAVVARSKVKAVGHAADDYLQAALRLTGAGKPIVIFPAQIAPVLALESVNGGRDARLGTDVDQLAALVARVAEMRDRPAREPRLSAPARPVILDAKDSVSWRPRSAEVRVVAPGRSGRAVRRDALAAAIARAIRAGHHSVKVPTQTLTPTATDRAVRRVHSLIGTFTTHYIPGQPRVTNIRLMARAIDGTVIAPGGRFSLNGVAGQRTSEGGYVEAPYIADGELKQTVGGGVSQVSTTIYNAAYFAGLKLDSHTPHSFFIDRYPAGRESTLNYPDIDLLWTNDTDAPVLIRTATDDTSVTVSIYGDNGGRHVRAQSGEREPYPGGDFQITVTRLLRYPDGRLVRQPFTTHYDTPPPE